ncbi:Histidine transport ATP-binding protein [Pseudomonas amygdali pv. tabaci]|uniref:Histidine transport ATP-binding protein n=1 Tax=Pseudomonas amygdali pv. tabaci TaxID=322 RepID=A0A3M6HAH9_PSEAJ|nr:Histidine transport ATP-binding protein [Pseudomonas amygdali pv. tabaci]
MVFQNYALFPHMTVAENLAFPLSVRGMSKTDVGEKVKKALGMVQLDTFAHRYPAQLSGGQQQRVAIARALAMEPQVILFDEPTSALDPELVGEVLKVIQGLAEEGRTMILVTHEMGFARKVASQVVFLHQGQIEESGHPDEVLNNPKSERLQQFLSGNLK